MKKILFAAAALFALASCNKEPEIPVRPDGAEVSITFNIGEMNTRAFFDNTSLAEAYEKVITKIDIYVCDATGKGIMHKRFDATEIGNLRGGLFVPPYCEGTVCTFYAIANHHRYLYFTDEAHFLEAHDDNNAPYTDRFLISSVYSRQSNGFTMSAKTTATIGPDGTVTNVSFVLKRTVAKIAIKTALVDGFAARYHNAKAWIKKVELTNCMKTSPLIGQSNYFILNDPLKVDQDAEVVDGYSLNLLYVFENPAMSAGGKRKDLIFTIVLDQDGEADTRDDRIESTATVQFLGHGDCEIRRNGYYRVQVTIRDYDAIEIISTVSSGDWEPPVTQVIDDLR